MILDRNPDWAAVESLVRDAFVQVATKQLVAALDGDDSAPVRRRSKPTRRA